MFLSLGGHHHTTLSAHSGQRALWPQVTACGTPESPHAMIAAEVPDKLQSSRG